MSDTDTLTPEDLAILSPTAEQPQPPPKVETPAESAPETPAPETPVAAAETPKPAETPPVEAKTTPEPKPDPGVVPRSRLTEEIQRRKAAEAEVASLKAPKPALPALDQDPVTNLDTRVGSTEQAVRQMLEAQQAQTFQSQVVGAYQADAARVRAENPAFNEAYNHWRDRTGAYFRHFNPGIEGPQLEQALNAHEFQFALNALRLEKSPGELIFSAAKELGWKPKEATPAAAPTPPAAPPAETLTQAVAKGQQAANPLAGGGATPTLELTAATLAAMSDEDFAKVSERDFRRVFGG